MYVIRFIVHFLLLIQNSVFLCMKSDTRKCASHISCSIRGDVALHSITGRCCRADGLFRAFLMDAYRRNEQNFAALLLSKLTVTAHCSVDHFDRIQPMHCPNKMNQKTLNRYECNSNGAFNKWTSYKTLLLTHNRVWICISSDAAVPQLFCLSATVLISKQIEL